MSGLLPGEQQQSLNNPTGEGEPVEPGTPESTPAIEPESEPKSEPISMHDEPESASEPEPKPDDGGKPETEPTSEDNWEKEFLKDYGNVQAETVEEALQNYNDGIKGFEASSQQLARFKALANNNGYKDNLPGFLGMLEGTAQQTVEQQSIKAEPPDFSDIEKHHVDLEQNFLRSFVGEPEDRVSGLQGLNSAKKAAMVHAQSVFDANNKNMQVQLAPIINAVAGMGALVQTLGLDSKWNGLPPETQKAYAPKKGEIINFIKGNSEVLMSETPFETAIRAMAATDPGFLKVQQKAADEKAAHKQDARLSRTKKNLAAKYGKGARRSALDGKTTEPTVTPMSSLKDVQKAKDRSFEKLQESVAGWG